MSHFAPGNNRMICHLFLKGIQADVAYRTTAKMAERKQARRRKLPGEGIRMFGKKGYHLTTVPMIVAAARSSIGSFYFYFRNKEDNFRSGVERSHCGGRAGRAGADESSSDRVRGVFGAPSRRGADSAGGIFGARAATGSGEE